MVSESRRDSARVFRYLQLRDQSVTPHSVIFVGRKKIKLRRKSGTFHDLAGRGTSRQKAGLSRQKRDAWQVCKPPRSASMRLKMLPCTDKGRRRRNDRK